MTATAEAPYEPIEEAYLNLVKNELIHNESPTIFRCSDKLNELFAAMSKAQGTMTGAKKESENPFFKSSYADLHSVIEATRRSLMEQGLCVIQTTSIINQSVFLLTTLGHSSGQWIQSRTPIIYDKGSIHSFGSGLTYARRYAWSAICGLAQMDDDGNAVAASPPRQQMNPDPINWEHVKTATLQIKEIIDADELNQIAADSINHIWDKLTNDERMAVHENLGEKAKGSKRMYKTILKDYQNYHAVDDMNI